MRKRSKKIVPTCLRINVFIKIIFILINYVFFQSIITISNTYYCKLICLQSDLSIFCCWGSWSKIRNVVKKIMIFERFGDTTFPITFFCWTKFNNNQTNRRVWTSDISIIHKLVHSDHFMKRKHVKTNQLNSVDFNFRKIGPIEIGLTKFLPDPFS